MLRLVTVLTGRQPSSARHDLRDGYFSTHSLALLASMCSTLIAALFLIGPILALYFVTDPDARLALVVAFIVLFGLGLSVSTGASRDAIFAATAAYTAGAGGVPVGRPGQHEDEGEASLRRCRAAAWRGHW